MSALWLYVSRAGCNLNTPLKMRHGPIPGGGVGSGVHARNRAGVHCRAVTPLTEKSIPFKARRLVYVNGLVPCKGCVCEQIPVVTKDLRAPKLAIKKTDAAIKLRARKRSFSSEAVNLDAKDDVNNGSVRC